MLIHVDRLSESLLAHGPVIVDVFRRALTQMIRAATRSNVDRVVQYDPTRIAVILPSTNWSDANRSAGRMRRALGGFRMRVSGVSLSFNVRIGLAKNHPHCDAFTLLESAERSVSEWRGLTISAR
jgi:PleD family two-component response regulator